MQLTGTRFGIIDYQESDVLNFAGGLIGFPQLKNFLAVPQKEGSPFHWLQSLEEPAVAFLTCTPWAYFPNYAPALKKDELADLSLTGDSAVILVTTSIPGGDVSQMAMNLAAPIVLNIETRQGRQVILEGEAYTIKHKVFSSDSPAPAEQAA
jgi:flagellar assembly factor FliW